MSNKSTSAPKVNPAVDVESMTNEQIREALLQYGEKVGPVIDSTRGLYKKKLIALRSSRPGNTPTPKTTASKPSTVPYKTHKSVPPPASEGQCVPPEETKPMRGHPVVIAHVTAISNEEIRSALKEFGKDPGPVVASTRRTYEKKLIKLQTRKIRAEAGDLDLGDLSSDDEDMDWCD